MMETAALDFLEQLLTTPGVSGVETPVQRVVANYARRFGAHVRSDLHGNLILSTGRNYPTRLMFAGHADQIGLIVSFIDEGGYLYTQTVGGWDPAQLLGQQVTVWSDGRSVPGVISRKAIHLQDEEERKKIVAAKSLYIDIGASNRAEAEGLVRVGDTVTLKLGWVRLENQRLAAPALDNRSGLWVVVEGMRRAMESGQLACELYVASTVQEEIGLRGAQTAAYSIDPHVAIAVDVTHATDCPDVETKQNGVVGLGRGPVIVRGPNMSPKVSGALLDLAVNHDIPYQVTALGRAASNDSNVLQISRNGVATGVVAIPNRYMHSAVEMVSLPDLEAAADLLMWFANSVQETAQFLETY